MTGGWQWILPVFPEQYARFLLVKYAEYGFIPVGATDSRRKS
jgi:hypothetical protein